MKIVVFSFLFLFVFIPTISGDSFGVNIGSTDTLEKFGVSMKETNVVSFNNNSGAVNNSIYWNGYPWSDTRWLDIDGGNANQNIDINNYNFTAGSIFANENLNVNGYVGIRKIPDDITALQINGSVAIEGLETVNKAITFKDTTSGELWQIRHRTDTGGNEFQILFYDGVSFINPLTINTSGVANFTYKVYAEDFCYQDGTCVNSSGGSSGNSSMDYTNVAMLNESNLFVGEENTFEGEFYINLLSEGYSMTSAPLVYGGNNYAFDFDLATNDVNAYVLNDKDTFDIVAVPKGESSIISSADGTNDFGVGLMSFDVGGGFYFYLTIYFQDDDFDNATDLDDWFTGITGGLPISVDYFQKTMWISTGEGNDYTWSDHGQSIVSGFTTPPTFEYGEDYGEWINTDQESGIFSIEGGTFYSSANNVFDSAVTFNNVIGLEGNYIGSWSSIKDYLDLGDYATQDWVNGLVFDLGTRVSGVLSTGLGGTGNNNYADQGYILVGNDANKFVSTMPTGSNGIQINAGNGTMDIAFNVSTQNIVTRVKGAQNQIAINGNYYDYQTGDINLTLPQNIATTSSPIFVNGNYTNDLFVGDDEELGGDLDIGGIIRKGGNPPSRDARFIRYVDDFTDSEGYGKSGIEYYVTNFASKRSDSQSVFEYIKLIGSGNESSIDVGDAGLWIDNRVNNTKKQIALRFSVEGENIENVGVEGRTLLGTGIGNGGYGNFPISGQGGIIRSCSGLSCYPSLMSNISYSGSFYAEKNIELDENLYITKGIPYANMVVCYIATGELGHCTTAVNSTGGCTCIGN